MSSATSLIVGYGNPLRGDDGIGPRIAGLCSAAGRNAVAATQLLPEHAEAVAAVQRVVFVDCHVGLKPGEVAVCEIEPHGSVLHDPASPASLLQLASQVFGAAPDAYLIGVGPYSLEFHDGLSDAVTAAIPNVMREIDALLARPEDRVGATAV